METKSLYIVMFGISSLLSISMLLSLVGPISRRSSAGAAFLSSTQIPPYWSGVFFASGISASSNSNNNEKLQSYYQLVVDENGGTSVKKRDFQNAEKRGYSNTPQLLSQLDTVDFATVRNVIFTQLMGDNPWHHCPVPQIVICTGGSGWWIETTDGKMANLNVGDILYQDNTANHPTAKKDTKQAQHYSGSRDGKPCDQVILQLDQKGGPIYDSFNKPGPL